MLKNACLTSAQEKLEMEFFEFFSGKNQKLRWFDISIPIFMVIACMIRRKKSGDKFTPCPN